MLFIGPEGTICESQCTGYIELHSGYKVNIEVNTTSEEAIAKGTDIYELHIQGGADGSLQLVLYDFSKLRNNVTNEDIICGTYGRQECVVELAKAVREKNREIANLVTPVHARNVQRIIAKMRKSGV